MKSSTGRWVSGDDFFNRKQELQILEARIRDFNHVLLTGQRRMGKTSLARELGRKLEEQLWTCLPADVQGATGPEDVIAAVAEQAQSVISDADRSASLMQRWLGESDEEVSARNRFLRVRSWLDAGNWRRYGEQLFRDCARHPRPVLVIIDELPIFLNRMLREENGFRQVETFLSWLRATVQEESTGSLAVLVSGSIGLGPLVQRLRIPDRINYLMPFRLGPWNRETCAGCLEALAESYELRLDGGVADAVYDALGLGVPYHIQAFFVHLRDAATIRNSDRVTVPDVRKVYHNGLLGPSGQNDLLHYETRLRAGLDDHTFRLAVEILAEAATQGEFTPDCRRRLEHLYAPLSDDPSALMTAALDVLMHDGYLEAAGGGYVFASRLLRDWWKERCRDHVPVAQRPSATPAMRQ